MPTTAHEALTTHDTIAAPALSYFNAGTFESAHAAAFRYLSATPHCCHCAAVLQERYDRVGDTLFRDDDPDELMTLFPREHRTCCAKKTLAASVVVFGRERPTAGTRAT
jgi:hypothetical protein